MGCMQVIPVIDLKGGQVVHARRGERHSYAPVRSALCAGSEPIEVVTAFLRVHDFMTFYVADLDAIQGLGDHGDIIAALGRTFPDRRFWVDNGLADSQTCHAWLARDLGDLVIGSEAQRDSAILDALADRRDRIILSLDHKDGRFLGPSALRSDHARWPRRVIAMTLSRVGSGSGPDFDLIDELHGRAPAKSIIAAGGVRGGDDLLALARRGVHGVLVATALHDRRIAGPEIAAASVTGPAR